MLTSFLEVNEVKLQFYLHNYGKSTYTQLNFKQIFLIKQIFFHISLKQT